MGEKLKIKARDAEDVTVLSSILQDALVALGDIVFVPEEKRFVFVANRFVWEKCVDVTMPPASAERDVYFRVHCGVTFEGVKAVKTRGINRTEKTALLELLAIKAEAESVELLFAGGASIRLDVAALHAHAADLDEPWPTPWRPHHPAVEGG